MEGWGFDNIGRLALPCVGFPNTARSIPVRLDWVSGFRSVALCIDVANGNSFHSPDEVKQCNMVLGVEASPGGSVSYAELKTTHFDD